MIGLSVGQSYLKCGLPHVSEVACLKRVPVVALSRGSFCSRSRPLILRQSDQEVSISCARKDFSKQRADRVVVNCAKTSEKQGSEDEAVKDRRLRVLSNALILACAGCRARSLSAAKCFVETVIEAFRQGWGLDELQMALSLINFEYGVEVVDKDDLDILKSWLCLVWLTIYQSEVQVRIPTKGVTSEEASFPGLDKDALGMLSMVKQIVRQFESGAIRFATLPPADEKASPFIKLMQQNTLLITLTLEILTARGFAQPKPSQPAQDPSLAFTYSPTGYLHSFFIHRHFMISAGHYESPSVRQSIELGELLSGDIVSDWGEVNGKESLCSQLLTGFMGGAGGSMYAMNFFVDAVICAYQEGLVAKDLVDCIDEQKFEDNRLFSVQGLKAREVAATKELFSRWISVVYIALAQMGVSYPQAGELEGWAWAETMDESSGGFEVTRLSDMVQNALRNCAEGKESSEEAMSLSNRLEDSPEVAENLKKLREEALTKQLRKAVATVVMEDEALGASSSGAVVFKQLVALVQLSWGKVNAAMQSNPQ